MMELVDPDFIKEQNLFNPESIEKLLLLVKSAQSANSEYTLWNLMIFNSWWIRNKANISV